MKSYLNKAERENYCVMALSAGVADEILKNWTNNLTADEHKFLKMAQTYIYKFMDSIKARVDKDFVRQLLRDGHSSEILVLPKLRAQREFKERKLDDGFIQVNKDTILNLAEHALIGCEGCTKDYTKCDLRQAYMELEIEAFNPDAKDKCQYKVEIEKKAV